MLAFDKVEEKGIARGRPPLCAECGVALAPDSPIVLQRRTWQGERFRKNPFIDTPNVSDIIKERQCDRRGSRRGHTRTGTTSTAGCSFRNPNARSCATLGYFSWGACAISRATTP